MKSLLIFLAGSLSFCAQAGETTPPMPDGRRLRQIVAENFPDGNVFIGTACHYNLLGSPTEVILDREFSYVTPANDFKQSEIHPMPDVWKWEKPDAWIRHCKENNQVLRLHAPISPQCSSWAKDDSRTAEELRQNLEEYMTALCKHYDKQEHVKWLDVVNETVLPNGQWFGPKPGTKDWQNPWPTIGYDESHPLRPPLYIKMAFEIANKYAPNTKLIINQHGEMKDVMWQKMKETVGYLRGQGLRVDGIGWQAHIDLGFEKKEGVLDNLRDLIDWAHANNLSFHVTENNVFMKQQKKDWDAQAETFRAIVSVLLEKRNSGVVTWNLWHIRDSECQKKELKGCMFFDDYSPKPAYYALQDLLMNPPAVTGIEKQEIETGNRE